MTKQEFDNLSFCKGMTVTLNNGNTFELITVDFESKIVSGGAYQDVHFSLIQSIRYQSDLKDPLKAAIQSYIDTFANKHELQFYGFVSDDNIGIAVFNEHYFINISDVIFDVDMEQPKGLIKEWYQERLEHAENINFQSYAKGVRYE